MSETGIHQFQLTDALGRHHDYLVTEHPAGEGMGIMFELCSLGAPSVLTLAGAALKSEELLSSVVLALRGGGGEADASGASDLGRMVSGLDLSSVGAELGRALATGQAPGLVRKVLSRTHRDGKPLSQALDLAYQANYLEMLQAVWKVCAINRFFPVPSTLLDFSSGPKLGLAARDSSSAA